MEISPEGHIRVKPCEISDNLDDPSRLINDVLIPGTPHAFPKYDGYCEFLDCCAETFGIHPRNILIRGSGKLGFSVSPKPEEAWYEMRPDSDLDLAFVDSDYYHYLDREIKMYERNPDNQAFSGSQFSKSIQRSRQRAYSTHRYFDLPEINCVVDHNQRLKGLPVEECCGLPRTVDTFVFRDWWCLHERWKVDLRDLAKAIQGGLQPGGNVALTLGSLEES